MSPFFLQGRLLADPARPPALGWIEVRDGRIAAMGEGRPPGEPVFGDADCIVSPGFIDAHLHLPQVDAIGYDGRELLEWLDEVIFPAEGRWAHPAVAAAQVADGYGRLLAAGTLGYAGYLTSHPHGLVAVAAQQEQTALRAIVGQVLMDREAPEELVDETIAATPSPTDRLVASCNPRFAIACSEGLLDLAGRLVQDGRPVQTHLAESEGECRRVAELFPDDPHYTAVYERHGLLGERTLLAHCIHLSPAEWDLIATRDAVVVHCPVANTFLRAGLFDLRSARERGVSVALGSDVAAGVDLAMPRVARAMIEVAKLRSLTVDSKAVVPTPEEAWSMITRGNADALGWSDAGRLEQGAVADLLLLRVPFEIDEALVGRMLYTWDERYIVGRVVAGEAVG